MKASKLLCVLTGLLCQSAFADWSLDNTQSQLNFLSTKKAQITEVHHFNQLSGQVSDLGKVEVEIDLTSVDTQIPIRNERMQQFLFETTNFAKATISAQLEPSFIQSLRAGTSQSMSLNASLNLHGKTQNIQLNILVFKDNNNNISVISRQPVVLNAADFELVAGINKLQELAGLPSITQVVPVTFALNFTPIN